MSSAASSGSLSSLPSPRRIVASNKPMPAGAWLANPSKVAAMNTAVRRESSMSSSPGINTYIASAAALRSNKPMAICSRTSDPDGRRTGQRELRRPGQLQMTNPSTPASNAPATSLLSSGGQYSTQLNASGAIIRLSPNAVRLPSQNVTPVSTAMPAMSAMPSLYGA